jgi:hypothetical protein
MASKPVILIVPGSFSSPSFYAPVEGCLRKYGYEIIVG